MWYYVFAIKIKYYEKRKVRHIAIPLHWYHDSYICISIIIQFSKKSHLPIFYTELKKEICMDFSIEPIWLVDFSFLQLKHN